MSVSTSVDIDKSDLEMLERRLKGIKNGVPKAISMAMNRTLKQSKSKLAKALKDEVNLPQKLIKGFIGIHRITNGRLTTGGIIYLNGRTVPLRHFSARQTRKGVTYKPSKSGPRKLLPSGFIPQRNDEPIMGGNVFLRDPGAKRLPISKQYGPDPEAGKNQSITSIASNAPSIKREINKEIPARLKKNLSMAVNGLIAREEARRNAG